MAERGDIPEKAKRPMTPDLNRSRARVRALVEATFAQHGLSFEECIRIETSKKTEYEKASEQTPTRPPKKSEHTRPKIYSDEELRAKWNSHPPPEHTEELSTVLGRK